MSSIYRPNLNGLHAGAINTAPSYSKLQQTGRFPTNCEGCSSVMTTMLQRSAYDKSVMPMYQSRVGMVDTNLLTLQFQS